MSLFPLDPTPPPMSAAQKITQRNRDRLAEGRHPATLLPLIETGETCGGCAHHHRYKYRAGVYHKCELHILGESHSAASDIRVGWPACTSCEADPT